MLEHYEIENLEQLRAIADMRRWHIIELLTKQPMTVTQLGELMGEPPAKVHYHVRELEKVGLLHLAETREKGGILEKYYEPVAREISVERQLSSAPPNEALSFTNTMLNQVRDDFQRAFRTALEQKTGHAGLSLAGMHIYVTEQEHKQLMKQVIDIFKPYENRRGIEGEQETSIKLISYPLPTGDSHTQPQVEWKAAPGPDTDVEIMARPGATVSISSGNWTVGVVELSRAELEKILAEGRRLKLHVVGVCSIAKNVDADLADRAIEELQLVGKLQASPAVREVVMKKRS